MRLTVANHCSLPMALALALSAFAATGQAADSAPERERVAALLAATPIIDGHDDLMIHFLTADHHDLLAADAYDISQKTSGQVDLPRLAAGHVGASIFTVGINNETDRKAGIRDSTALLRAIAARYPDRLAVVTDADALVAAMAKGKVAALMGLEGGDQIGGSLDVLRETHRQGVRAMTLTWERSNDIGDSNADAPHSDGLSPFGSEVVREMNRLGMLVDLSHAADSTAFDVLELTTVPLILSHSLARSLAPAPRNAPDELLTRVADNDGVVMIHFVPYYATSRAWTWYEDGEATWAKLKKQYPDDRVSMQRDMAAWAQANPPPVVDVSAIADHVDHVRKVAGINHVGIGADFDGMDEARTTGLEDASTFPALFEELARRGWSDADLKKLASENFLRVLRAVEAAAEKKIAAEAL